MKKILSFMMIAALASSFASCGSDDDAPTPGGTTVLSTPAPTIDAASISETGFTVAWPAVANAASYLYKIDNGAETAVTNTSVVVSGLTAGQTYTVSVKAVSGNTSLYTDSAWGTVTATTLAPGGKTTLSTPAPTVDAASITASGFTVSWAAVANAGSYVYKVNNGAETAVSSGTSVSVTGLSAATTYTVSVKAVPSDAAQYAESAWGTVTATTAGGSTGNASLAGSAYFPIVLDGVSYEKVQSKVLADFRPNEETSFLYVWDATYTAGTCTGPNFYGEMEEWTSLVMGSLGWAGAGFCVKNGALVDQLAQIMSDPSAWYLHIGIKSSSTDNYAHTIRLADGSNTVDLVLVPGGDYNYTRDNEWQEIEVPMSYFTAKGINYRTGNADTDFNVAAIVDADHQPVAVAGTQINYDALFIYKK